MTPLTAIKTCLRKSFSYSGRAVRSEFWWFAPVGIAMSAALSWIVIPLTLDTSVYAKIGLNFALLAPVWSAGARRLQDTGEAGQDIFLPFVYLGFACAAIAFLASTIWAIYPLILSPYLLFGLFLLTVFIIVPLTAVTTFLAISTLGPTIGQLIVSSEIQENRYGPPPISNGSYA